MIDPALRYVPDSAVPPGDVLAELLEERGMTQTELARRAGLSKDHVSRIVRGVAPLSYETALCLERVLQMPASLWIRLEATYQELRERAAQETELSGAADIVREFPYAELVKHGCVAPAPTTAAKAAQLLAFMGLGSFSALQRQYPITASLRVAATKQPSQYALAAWLRMGELAAERIETAPFDEQALKRSLPLLRELTCEESASFQYRLRDLLAACGVAFCLVPHLSRTYAHGAALWVRPDKAIVELSIRGAYLDVFWFSLFHELGHLLLHSKKRTFVTFDSPSNAPEEAEANRFAQETLIPGVALTHFLADAPRVSRQRILRFAEQVGVCPAVVVGRLQHEKILPQGHLSNLRPRLKWAEPETSNCSHNSE
ncbi:MAG: ImmA/IrrE family metallo-endopeptidase [Armatimonadia bacterium]